MDGYAKEQDTTFVPPEPAGNKYTHPILHAFDRQVRACLDAIAIVDGPRTVTFGDLNARANRLAQWLSSRGIGRQALVAIAVERSVEMLVSVLGVLKAGAGYVPLDPGYPQARLRAMLGDSQVALLICDSALSETLASPDLPVLRLDTHGDKIAADQSPDDLPLQGAPSDLCYVIYTSGSTGTPKGVAMSHGALGNLISWQLDRSASRALRTAQFAPLSFDVSFQEIFATLCGGGTLILVPESARKNPAELIALLIDRSVERLFLPYVALQHLAEEAVRRSLFPLHLREVITAGEQLKITPAIAEFFTRLDNCTLENQYGPSETHVVTAYTLSGPPQTWPPLPPIGRPTSKTEAYVLDDEMQPVAPGEEGELYFAGAALANGYLHRPDLTDERFPVVSIGNGPAVRLYRTGDRAAWLPGGDLQFFGRSDDQVKIRGFRVEPGEVEQSLLTYPGVRQAVVVPQTDGGGQSGLAAYLVTDPDAPFGAYDVRMFLAQRLPDYLVPSAIVFLDALPLTPSGKVDRRALVKPAGLRRDLPTPFLPAKGETECVIARTWQGVLQIDRVGADDNFFDLGGTSLQMIEVQRRLGAVIQPCPEITDLFQYPTVAALARHLARRFMPDNAPNTDTPLRANALLSAAERVRRQRAMLAQQGQRR